eukprot:6200593-Pyramimonas_sp.AAC.1
MVDNAVSDAQPAAIAPPGPAKAEGAMHDPAQPVGPAGPASSGDTAIKSEPMEVDMEAVPTGQTELEARYADASTTKEPCSSPDAEAEPAEKEAPPVAAPSGQDVAEPSSAVGAPGAPDTPASIEASPPITDLAGFPYQEDPATVYPDDDDIRLGPTATNFFCRETLPPPPD